MNKEDKINYLDGRIKAFRQRQDELLSVYNDPIDPAGISDQETAWNMVKLGCLMLFWQYWHIFVAGFITLVIAIVLFVTSGCTAPVTLTPEATVEPTPTLEIVGTWAIDCVPDSYGQIQQDTWLYKDATLTTEAAWVEQWEFVDLIERDTNGVWWSVTHEGERREGYVPPWVLPVECR